MKDPPPAGGFFNFTHPPVFISPLIIDPIFLGV
jgi:hypothetical protein